MSFLSPQDLRGLFDQLCSEYEYLSDNRSKLEADCNKLREYIEAQVTQIKQLNQDFEKLKQEFAQRGAELPPRQTAPVAQVPPQSQSAQQIQYSGEQGQQQPQEEPPEQDWELITLAEKIQKPVIIALLAEIVDISVICSTAFSPDGTCLAIGSDKTLRVYNIDKDDFLLQHTIGDNDEEGTTNHVRSISWTADSQKIVCGGEDGHIRVFELPNGEMTQNFEAGNGEVFQVQISASGTFFAAVTGDGCLTLISMTDFSRLAVMTRQMPENSQPIVATSLAVSNDDKKIVVGYSDKVIALWDAETKACLVEKECHKDGVYAVKFLPNGKMVSASLDSTVKIWNIIEENGQTKLELWKELDGHTNFVLSLAVDPSGTWLLSGSKDLSARLSNVETGEMIYSIKAHTNSIITVAFNPSGLMFCTGSGDQSVKIWSITPEETEDAA
ncbi:Transcriptional repressor tup11-related protein [Tritrichomonas foetus]|uniref:Transcriptional repressor tup11-related protein n=1 Tax=Tritrichomonas foetus TaxID=1144522 RepID=A0A1J4KL85_9EUKA|nr:Transcriptional repressor tup11-related protein [Tritrichomonas foetus]|eukprot:OHT11898.1 Transcriptional repressor tup11-related protein [Tritrichomonas foetus]